MSLAARWLSGSNNPSKQASVDWGNAVLASINVGLFTEASSATVPTDVTTVRTAGYSSSGLGAAEYIYDASVNSTTVASNPRTQFVTANGRGFKLSPYLREVTPPMFGAVPGEETSFKSFSVSDCLDALDALVAFARENATTRTIRLNFEGIWGVSGPFDLDLNGDTATDYRTRPTIVGGTFVSMAAAKEDMPYILKINAPFGNLEGRFIAWGMVSGSSGPSGRRAIDGILVANCPRTVAASFQAERCYRWGIRIWEPSASDTKTIGSVWNQLVTASCGLNASDAITATFDSNTANGSSDSPLQYTTLHMTSAIPAHWELGTMLMYKGGYHHISSINDATQEITVAPWLPDTDASGTLTDVSGGGTTTCGENGSPSFALLLDHNGGGTGFVNGASYVTHIGAICTQNCQIGLFQGRLHGGNPTYRDGTRVTFSQNVFKLKVGIWHCEMGSSTVEFMQGMTPIWTTSTRSGKVMSADITFGLHAGGEDDNLRKCVKLAPRTLGTLAQKADLLAFCNVRINGRAVMNGRYVPRPATNFTMSNAAFENDITIFDTDTRTVTFYADESMAEKMGMTKARLVVHGTGANKEPTGTITITPHALNTGMTLNGAASVAVSGATGPLQIDFEIDTSASPTNVIVTKTSRTLA